MIVATPPAAQPHPGADLLERLAKAEAVVAAARGAALSLTRHDERWGMLRDALADYDVAVSP